MNNLKVTRKSWGILILFLLVLPAISAVEFDMKSNFSQGETLLARVSGNFVDPILKGNVFFYKGSTRVPMDFNIVELEGEFYIYVQLLGKEKNNYSISIEDVNYVSGREILDDNIVKNFTITNESADFTITPGAVNTNKGFSVTVQNLKDYKINLLVKTKETTSKVSEGFFGSLFGEVKEEKEGTTIAIKSGEIKKIDFTLINFTKSELKKIEFSSNNLIYEIPVYVFLNGTTEQEKGIRAMEFDIPSLNISVPTNSEATRITYLKNIGEEKLENITLILSEELKPYLNFSITQIEDIKKNRSEQID
ncbi:MAG: hypothetical protein AABX88_00020, partial [Nanoarchaeota archaeon]